MNAIIVHKFGPAEVMKYKESPDPVAGPGEVIVRVVAVGVNPVDTYIRSGIYANKPDLPYTPGTDAGGLVESVGDGVESLAIGDAVYTAGSITGSYAGLIRCEWDQVHKLPVEMDPKLGAAVNVPYATAYRALFQRGGARAGETLLVHGASGAVGVAAVQLATAFGMSVIGTAGTERGADLVRSEGADEVLNHHEDSYLDRVLDATGGRGVDLILEMLSDVNLAADLGVLARRGRVAVIGCRGTIEINPRDVMAREADIRGVMLMGASTDERRDIHAGIGSGLANGTLRPVTGREFPLKEAPAAHEAVLASGAYGKIVLLP
jgi:NADPH2:quinone reductase